MRSFTYERATSVDGAVRAAAAPEVKFVAGGTNLLDLMKLEIEYPAHLVDVNDLPLKDIGETAEGGLRIGALMRNADLAADPRVRTKYPVLTRALLAGASGQLRNMATTGGNLLQRTRCFYFYDRAMPCNKRTPGSGCSALQGYNRIHAVVGASDQCIAVHPSDMAVAMRVLDASVETMSAASGKRTIPIADFYRLPGNAPNVETALRQGELITGVVLPPPPRGRQVYRKVRDRASYAFALVSVAAIVDLDAGHVRGARVACGGIAPQPWRVAEAERRLADAPLTPQTADAAADALLAGARTHAHNTFKLALTRNTVAATLREAARS